MRVNGQCLYWTSPCIVPLTLYHLFPSFSSLSNDKFSVLSKLKAFADDNSIVTKMTKFAGDSLENIVGKGDNAGYQHFLLFQQCFFFKAPYLGLVIGWIVWLRGNNPFEKRFFHNIFC